MIYADLYGKSQISEDRLTSNCLGLLDLLPNDYLLDFFTLAQSVAGICLELEMRSDCDVTVSFWPYLPGGGIPDAMVTIDGPGSRRFKIIVEAKRGGAQSGEQLSSYLRAAYALYRDRCALIYLTHHRSFPKEECELSEKIADVPAKVYWLSWHTLFSWSQEQLSRRLSQSYSERRILELLVHYLAEIGYLKFTGFSPLPKGFVAPGYKRLYLRPLSFPAARCQPLRRQEYRRRFNWQGPTATPDWPYAVRQGG